jgi:hypothetical protein
MPVSVSNEVREALNFRPLEASFETMSFFQNAKKESGGHEMKCLPIIENNHITYPTFQKHIKFAIRSCVAPKDESKTYIMIISFLIEFYGFAPEFFKGHGQIPKCGLLTFPDNENATAIRLWSSKQVGKSVIYELTVVGYKDAVPKPMEDKPKWKKVIVNDE